MDERRRPADLERLRERLYRPDPPADAADAYRAALVADAPPQQTARARRRPPVALWAAVAAVAVLAILGVLRPAPQAGTPASTAAAASVPRVDQFTAALTPPSVPGTLLAERTSADRPRAVTIDAGGRVVAVAVLCEVDGVLIVRLGARDTTTFICTRSGPALALIRSTAPLGVFELSVSAEPGVRWALSVGAEEGALGFAE